MTAVSKPNSRPPSEATRQIRARYQALRRRKAAPRRQSARSAISRSLAWILSSEQACMSQMNYSYHGRDLGLAVLSGAGMPTSFPRRSVGSDALVARNRILSRKRTH